MTNSLTMDTPAERRRLDEMHQGLVGEPLVVVPCRRLPALPAPFEDLLVAADRVERAPVLDRLVLVVDIVYEEQLATGADVLLHELRRGLLHQRDEPAFQQRPRRGCRDLRGGDSD